MTEEEQRIHALQLRAARAQGRNQVLGWLSIIFSALGIVMSALAMFIIKG